MYANSILAVSGALFAAAAAVPLAEPHQHHHRHHHARDQLHARDVIWETDIEVVYETIPVTVTVWVDDDGTPETTATPKTPVSYPAETTAAVYTPPAPPAYTPKTTSTSTSIYVAPAPAAYTPKTTSTTTSSIYVAPVPATTSTTVAPAPYVAPPTYEEPSTSTTSTTEAAATPPAAPSESTPSSGGSSVTGMAAAGKMYTGDLTWYDVGLGACGKSNVASDHVIAIPESIFDAYSTGNPNTNPLCGKTISITGKDGSKYTGTVVDRCTGCKTDDLDLSQDFFNTVTNNGDGRVGDMSWCFDD